MTRAELAQYAEWARTVANGLQVLELTDTRHPQMESRLSGIEKELYIAASTRAGMIEDVAIRARKDFEALAQRLEAMVPSS